MSDGVNCLRCATPLAPEARFCSSCGNAKEAGPSATAADATVSRQRRRLAVAGIFAATVLFVAAERLGILDDLSRGFISGLGFSAAKLSVEVSPFTGMGANSHLGWIKVTNIDDQPVTLVSASINHRADVACTFGRKGTPIESKSALQQGDSVMLSTPYSIMGGCGAIVSVSIETDKGTGEYEIVW
jgi:hypothetical protein